MLVLSAGVAGARDIGDYPLDAIPRVLSPGDELPCARDELVLYRGELVRYQRPARVHRAFKPSLLAFERLVVDTAHEVYGRAPTRLWHLGAHNCRRMRRYPDWVSEHALGNALDVAGFDFGPLPRGARLPEQLPPQLRWRFSVRLLTHWQGRHGAAAVHAGFLRRLAQRVIERPDVFRTVLGPAWPGHKNHFHLDFAPYRVVEVF
jgi:hypothetical protein